MAGVSERPDAFFRLSPVADGKAQCFVVRRGEVERRAIGAALYTPELRLFIDRLSKHPSASGFLRDYVDINPRIDASELEPDSPVSFVPMHAVEDGATGGVSLSSKRLAEVQKGYTPFAEGDILWAKITPCMENGKSCVASGLINGIGFGSTEFHVLRSHDGRLSQSFLWEFLNQATLRRVARFAFTGSAGHQRIPDSFLADLPFPLLSSSEQERLVSRMGAARAERREKQAEADALLVGLDDYLIATLGLTPPPKDERKVFAVQRADVDRKPIGANLYAPALSKFLHALSKSRFPTRRLRDEVALNPAISLEGLDADTPVSFIPMEAVEEGATGTVHLQTRLLAEVQKGYTAFANGDVLWAKITPCMENGKSCIAAGLTNGVGFGSTEFHVLRPLSNRVAPEYIHEFVSQALLRRVARLAFTGSAGHQRVPGDFLANLPFPVPPIAVQETIATEARRRRDEARRLRTEAEAGWQAAKRWFEEQLLGPAQP